MLDYLGLVLAREFMHQQIDGTQPVLAEMLNSERKRAHTSSFRGRIATLLRRAADRMEPVGEMSDVRR